MCNRRVVPGVERVQSGFVLYWLKSFSPSGLQNLQLGIVIDIL